MEEELIYTAKLLLTLFFGGFVVVLANLCNDLVLKPRRLRSRLKSQGISGPSPSFLYGNIPEIKKIGLRTRTLSTAAMKSHKDQRPDGTLTHDWPTTVFPHIEQWRNEYGPTFMYSTGNIQILCTTDPEMVKEVNLCTSLNLGKPSYLSKDRGPLLGHGILSSSGHYWAHQRKIIAPELYLDKVKGMVKLMVESASIMLQSWENIIENGGGNAVIKVDQDLRSLSADIISRACFGSSYAQGENIFLKLRALQNLMSKGNIGVPGLRYLPNKNNRDMWRLEKEINSMIFNVVKERSEANCERDLLQLILEGAKSVEDKGETLPIDITPRKFIIDNCKNIYFAGYETTAISASWCLMLLAAYPEWQSRVRSEVVEICEEKLPDAEMLGSMKVLTMVIQETLRLYSPVAYVIRETLEDMTIKHIKIPKGMTIQIPKDILHQHPDLWGPEAGQFNPERFANGITGACRIPATYVPFGVGARTCAGQHFAMMELKAILSLILSRFSFSLSTEYQHSPVFNLVIEPEHEVILHFKRVGV